MEDAATGEIIPQTAESLESEDATVWTLKIKPDIMFTDGTPYDAEAAGKAGLATIGMLCGGFPEADLSAAGCVAIYRDPRDLLDGFEQSLLVTR